MTKTMPALAKTQKSKGLELIEAPVPEPGPNDLRIRIHKTAICGTDLHIYNWDRWAQETIPVPMITGHEYVGYVDAIGSHVKGYQPGDRVSGEGHLTCGICRNCRAGSQHLCRNTVGVGVQRDGCFAEYLVIPACNAYKIPDDISDDMAAVFDPFGNAVHTALSFDLVGEDVLITGAGPIGIMAAAVCRHVGARHVVITDINDYRLSLAAKIAPKITAVNTKSIKVRDVFAQLGMREGFDVGLEMSGNAAAYRELLEVMNHGGKVALLGIFPEDVAIDWSKVIFKGLCLKGIYGREMYETWYKMTSLLQSGLNIDPVITHRFEYQDYLRGFEVLNQGKAAKVILSWA